MPGEKVVVAEDNPKDREFLVELLHGYDVILTASGREALNAAQALDAPRVISDIQMADGNGIELAKRLWRDDPSARILFWSQYDDEIYVRSLAKIIPADTVYGYVLKSNTPDTLRRAIDTVFHEDQCWVDPDVRKVQARATQSGNGLTDNEYEALIYVALGLTDNLIAKRTYLSRRGVQSRLKSLYTKLGVIDEQCVDAGTDEVFNARTRAVCVALQRGLINAFELRRESEQLKDWLAHAIEGNTSG